MNAIDNAVATKSFLNVVSSMNLHIHNKTIKNKIMDYAEIINVNAYTLISAMSLDHSLLKDVKSDETLEIIAKVLLRRFNKRN